jgi:DNA-binding protein HU-beta
MTTIELAKAIAKKHDLAVAPTRAIVDEVFEHVAAQLSKGKSVRFGKLGSFAVTKRKARLARNPKTGAAVKVPARRVVKFKAASTIRNALNKTKG